MIYYEFCKSHSNQRKQNKTTLPLIGAGGPTRQRNKRERGGLPCSASHARQGRGRGQARRRCGSRPPAAAVQRSEGARGEAQGRARRRGGPVQPWPAGGGGGARARLVAQANPVR